jgi:hypothetical protein
LNYIKRYNLFLKILCFLFGELKNYAYIYIRLLTNKNYTTMTKMKNFKIKWEIDLDATDPTVAALEALATQRDLSSEAIFFEVENTETKEVTKVDLLTIFAKIGELNNRDLIEI